MALRIQNEFSPIEICTAYNPDWQAKLPAACSNIYSAYSVTDTPTLACLYQAYGDVTALAWIKAQLIRVNDFVGTRLKLTDDQLEDLAIQILAEYDYLNMLEFILFCGRLRSGKYEDFYSSVDPMRILKSLDCFCRDRTIDINHEITKIEKEKRDKEREESAKNAISLEQYVENCKAKGVELDEFILSLVSNIHNKDENGKK